MPSAVLRAQRAEIAHPGCAPLLSGLEFDLPAGWTGIVGPNGAGKTTLLRLLARELPATGGAVVSRGRVAICAQAVDDPPAEARELDTSWERAAVRLRDGFELAPLERWETLSPGERKRWQVAAALYAEPEVLLLDEPTNHLDPGARALLVRALGSFRGIGAIVSHDRALLDALTSATLRVASGTALLYPGPYSAARPLWEAALDARRAMRDAAHRKAGALRARLADARRAQQGASARKSAGARMKDKHDSDAREIGARNRIDMAEARHGRTIATVRRAHEAAEDAASALAFPELEVGDIFARYEPCPRPWVMPGVRREDRVWISGPNGSGKTTLLRAMLDASDLPRERVLYLPQNVTQEDGREILDDARALPRDEKGRVMQVVALLGVDPDALLRSPSPSPGEARKLLLALGLTQSAWVLALDEPTNHLDLPSVARIEAALQEYPGALLLITHDERLARALTVREVACGGVEPARAPIARN
jgi:ATPase subunit of ABC transporter with duplicated ATPase domains